MGHSGHRCNLGLGRRSTDRHFKVAHFGRTDGEYRENTRAVLAGGDFLTQIVDGHGTIKAPMAGARFAFM